MTHQHEFGRQLLCDILGLARSTFYYQAQPADDSALREAMEEIALEFPRYGYRRITAELRRRGWVANHKRVLCLMREANLLVEVRRFCRTTDSRHSYGRYPNLVKGTVTSASWKQSAPRSAWRPRDGPLKTPMPNASCGP